MSRLARGGDKKAREKLIAGNAGFAYKVAKKYALLNRRWRHVDEEDILQASLIGLIEAVDRFDPDRGNRFTTYANFWIFKRVLEDIYSQLWVTVKPPLKDTHSFFRKMGETSQEESDAYVDRFILRGDSHPDESQGIDDGYGLFEFESIAEMANLSVIEMAIFHNHCHGTTITFKYDGDMNEAENSMLDKLRGVIENDTRTA